jgi:hypothetical protein
MIAHLERLVARATRAENRYASNVVGIDDGG